MNSGSGGVGSAARVAAAYFGYAAESLKKDGAIASPMNPGLFAAFIRSKLDEWQDVIRNGGITATPV